MRNIYNMMDNFAQSKKGVRGGSRGAANQGSFAQNGVVSPKPGMSDAEQQKLIRTGKIKLDKLQKQQQSELGPSNSKNVPFGAIKDFQSQMMAANASPSKLPNKLTIIEVEQTEVQKRASLQSPQGQGVQGQQAPQDPKKRNPKIAVISLTTKQINDKTRSPEDSEANEDEPDERAQPQLSATQKRFSQKHIQM